MRLPTSELRPGLAYACEWLQDALSDFPEVAKAFYSLTDCTPWPLPEPERKKFEASLSKHPLYNRGDIPLEVLFERAGSAYINPSVEAMWMGWQMKTDAVDGAFHCHGLLESLEPVLGYSYVDGNGQSQWRLDHPVASGREPNAIDIEAVSLSEYAGIGGSLESFKRLRRDLDQSIQSIFMDTVVRYNAMLSNPQRNDLPEFRKVMELLFRVIDEPLSPDWETRDLNIQRLYDKIQGVDESQDAVAIESRSSGN